MAGRAKQPVRGPFGCFSCFQCTSVSEDQDSYLEQKPSVPSKQTTETVSRDIQPSVSPVPVPEPVSPTPVTDDKIMPVIEDQPSSSAAHLTDPVEIIKAQLDSDSSPKPSEADKIDLEEAHDESTSARDSQNESPKIHSNPDSHTEADKANQIVEEHNSDAEKSVSGDRRDDVSVKSEFSESGIVPVDSHYNTLVEEPAARWTVKSINMLTETSVNEIEYLDQSEEDLPVMDNENLKHVAESEEEDVPEYPNDSEEYLTSGPADMEEELNMGVELEQHEEFVNNDENDDKVSNQQQSVDDNIPKEKKPPLPVLNLISQKPRESVGNKSQANKSSAATLPAVISSDDFIAQMEREFAEYEKLEKKKALKKEKHESKSSSKRDAYEKPWIQTSSGPNTPRSKIAPSKLSIEGTHLGKQPNGKKLEARTKRPDMNAKPWRDPPPQRAANASVMKRVRQYDIGKYPERSRPKHVGFAHCHHLESREAARVHKAVEAERRRKREEVNAVKLKQQEEEKRRVAAARRLYYSQNSEQAKYRHKSPPKKTRPKSAPTTVCKKPSKLPDTSKHERIEVSSIFSSRTECVTSHLIETDMDQNDSALDLGRNEVSFFVNEPSGYDNTTLDASIEDVVASHVNGSDHDEHVVTLVGGSIMTEETHDVENETGGQQFDSAKVSHTFGITREETNKLLSEGSEVMLDIGSDLIFADMDHEDVNDEEYLQELCEVEEEKDSEVDIFQEQQQKFQDIDEEEMDNEHQEMAKMKESNLKGKSLYQQHANKELQGQFKVELFDDTLEDKPDEEQLQQKSFNQWTTDSLPQTRRPSYIHNRGISEVESIDEDKVLGYSEAGLQIPLQTSVSKLDNLLNKSDIHSHGFSYVDGNDAESECKSEVSSVWGRPPITGVSEAGSMNHSEIINKLKPEDMSIVSSVGDQRSVIVHSDSDLDDDHLPLVNDPRIFEMNKTEEKSPPENGQTTHHPLWSDNAVFHSGSNVNDSERDTPPAESSLQYGSKSPDMISNIEFPMKLNFSNNALYEEDLRIPDNKDPT